MPSPAGRLKAVMFRRKIYVGENHKDAIDLVFSGMSDLAVQRLSDRIADGKEFLLFGYAKADGSDWLEGSSQEARKIMYGFETRY